MISDFDAGTLNKQFNLKTQIFLNVLNLLLKTSVYI